MKKAVEFVKRNMKSIITVIVVGLALWMWYNVGYRQGYNRASEEVAVTTQYLLMENCLSFNANLESLGKLERMDCSLFSDLNPSAGI